MENNNFSSSHQEERSNFSQNQILDSGKERDIKKSNKETVLRNWFITVIVGIAAGFVIFGLLKGREFLANFLSSKEAERITKEIERPYREDRFGGETPGETFDMFLDALKKGDIELASKYFTLKKQDDWEESLRKIKENNQLEDFIRELENIRMRWKIEKNDNVNAIYEYSYIQDKSTFEELPTRYGTQKIEFPPGEYKAEIIFEKNQFNGLWKIVLL